MLDAVSLASIVMAVTLSLLIIGSYIDLKTGEIPDKITLGLTVIILILSGIYSLTESNTSSLTTALSVGLLYFILGYLLYRLGEWGGGDVKLIAGIGCSLGFLETTNCLHEGILPYYLDYLLNIAIVSPPYLLIYTFLLGLMNPKVFTTFRTIIQNRIIQAILLLSLLPVASALWLGLGNLTLIYVMVPVLLLLSIYLRAVEKEALQKTVKVSDLREGDVVAEDLLVDGKRIAHSRNISGFSAEDIEEMKGLSTEGKIPREIRIKWGVKFAPIFLMAFLLSILVGNTLEVFVGYLATP